MERLGDGVGRELRRLGAPADVGDLLRAWDGVVGEAIARNAVPARIARDGTLHVATSSSAWAFELGHLEPDLLARLAHALGDAVPHRLRFAVGPLPERSPATPDRTRGAVAEPTAEHRAAAAELTAGIDDDELRAGVARAAAASLARATADRPF